jgi:hypothetical protein
MDKEKPKNINDTSESEEEEDDQVTYKSNLKGRDRRPFGCD